MRVLWAVFLLASCGRIGFDPEATARDAARPDVGNVGDPCTVDASCGRCQRCRANVCVAEPIGAVFTGHQSTCFLGESGSRWCTGEAAGLGAPSDGTPRRIAGEDGWTALFLGFGGSYGLRGGALWGWSGSNPPAAIDTAPSAIRQVSAEDAGYCVIATDATLQCSGGNGTITEPGTWKWADHGFGKQCAITTAGELYCWGTNQSNALGLGVEADGTQHDTPARVGTDSDWSRVAVGSALACATKTAGTMWCWGGPAMTGTNGVDTLGVPTMISPDTDWTWIDVHWLRACAGKTDGRIFCWGVGDGHEVVPGMMEAAVPVPMPGGWDDLALGGHHYCGRKGTSWSCWGLNATGQLGFGDTASRDVPTPLCGP